MNAIPLATYRLQFGPDFGFSRCQEILSYLEKLGVTDIYASPIFKPRPGSTHGYDICDHQKLNPELGSEEEFQNLISEAQALPLGWIQDIVPNHMAVSGKNRLLVDLLENGPASKYFRFFDIDWEHPYENLHGRMLAPFLGDFYGETLEKGEIRLDFDENGFYVHYYDLRLPLRLDSYALILTLGIDRLRHKLGRDHPDYIKLLGILYSIKSLPAEEPLSERYDQIYFIKRMLSELKQSSPVIRQFIEENLDRFNGGSEEYEGDRFDLLDSLLAEQFFRLSFWKVAAEEINYRRFFSINDLISLRIEEEAVFNYSHDLVFKMVKNRIFSGLRVDHIDGLYDPTVYLRRLRENTGPIYLVVEKILEKDENLPTYWPVQGTTGYDFMNCLGGLWVDGKNENAFSRIYSDFTRLKKDWTQIVAEKKRWIIERYMAGDVSNLARLVKTVSSKDRYGFDITFQALSRAITEVLVNFPIYRTYINNDSLRPEDLAYICAAIGAARKGNPDLRLEFDFLERFLLLHYGERTTEEDRKEWINFVMRFQQYTGPLMAKGFEDSALYVMNRLLCLNEVGGWPDHFGLSPDEWHQFIDKRMRQWPAAMNATATHDTKRGEDARMRLAALSEIPEEWQKALKHFKKINSAAKDRREGQEIPDANDEYFLYQTMLASWPFSDEDLDAFRMRLREYLVKAVREAKEHTGWLKPDEEYEEAFVSFAETITRPSPDNSFLEAFRPLQKKAAHLGVINSLAQTLIKITSPGVPDFYQGTELWDLSFVDPDNRRPVDFGLRTQYLDQLIQGFQSDLQALSAELLQHPEDGRIKMFLIHRALAARRQHRALFLQGEYQPISFSGRRRDHVFGFARRLNKATALTITPRLVSPLVDVGQYPLGSLWDDTRISLEEALSGPVVEAVTGRRLSGRKDFYLRDVLDLFPVALLIAGG